jgi:putative phosphoesterase
MKVAIISDSHYSTDKVRQLFTHLAETGVQHVIHAGDFIGNGIDKVFKDFPNITVWVARGNCDSRQEIVEAINGMEHVTVADIVRFELEGVSFLVAHIPGMALSALNKEHADVIIHGHTHIARIEKHNNSLILNPGSIMDGDGYMILQLPDLKVERLFNY